MLSTRIREMCCLLGFAAVLMNPNVFAQEACEQDDPEACVSENSHAGQHVHFSSKDIDFYEGTPDTLYQNADWPARVEEYSDYLSH